MMKFVTSDSTTALSLRHGEQYDNCSEMLIEPDTTPLAALDPAILSCGLPAIVLDDGGGDDNDSMKLEAAHSTVFAGLIRYTVAQLLAYRKSPFSHRRPAAIDDPRTVQYPIWRRTGFERVRSVSAAGEEEQYLLYGGGGGGSVGGGSGRKPNDRQRDNGFNPPRFRRNHEFSNRNHHVIVKSYSAGYSDGCGHNVRLQDTIIEEEPEWVAAGPTSRLDTIELRGFDEDLTRNVTDSLKGSPPAGHGRRSSAFYDELLHYEHVHPKQQGGAKGHQHDTSGGADGGESVVSTSASGSPPPARSTPTKHVADMNNNNHHHHQHGGRKGGAVATDAPGCSSGVNVSNFEEFMKFDAMLGDQLEGNGSRFSKYFRRVGSAGGGGAPGATGGGHNSNYHAQQQQQQHQNQNQHHHQQHHVRFALERNTHHYQQQQQQQQPSNRPAGSGRLPLSALQHPPTGMERPTQQQQHQHPYDSGTSSSSATCGATDSSSITAPPGGGDSNSFQRLLEMMAAQNQRMQHQQQQHYLLQLMQNTQQTEALRQMLMKKCSLEGGGAGGQQRVPTQAELQLHTQSIMKQALLRKKIAEQSRLILEQHQEPIPAVQQLIQSICPNVQRSISVLGGGGGGGIAAGQPGQQPPGGGGGACHFGAEARTAGNGAPGANGPPFAGGGNRAPVRPAGSTSNRRY